MSEAIRLIGAKEFEKAIKSNPKYVLLEGKKLIQRTKAYITRQLKNNPWRVGDSSGKGKGIPVSSGSAKGRLRSSLLSKPVSTLSTKLYIDETQANYAKYVHGGTGRMKERPFMDRAKTDAKPFVKKQGIDFLKKIVKNLAK